MENISIVETLKYINENISEIDAEFHDEFKRLIKD